MSRKLVFLGIISLVLAPGAAQSLGLGEIRLNSYLNQPIDAEIALSIAAPAELETLRVELASAEAFSRYGLARPAFFDELRFQVRRTGPSSAVVQVSSTRPVVEPFLTFLLEARWSGGRALREYTVLLDPPVFLPGATTETVPAAPAPAAAAPRPAPVDYGPEYGPVQRNETLWAIAQRVRPDESLSTNQVMIALFRANPNAFDGNINRLRAGVVMRVPSRQEMAAASAAEATAEVRRHTQEWRQAAAAPVERRLELAPPSETARPAAPVPEPVAGPAPAAGTAPESAELLDAVRQMRDELADTRRLIEVKDAEIAALQARLAELESEPVAGAPAAAPVEAEPAPAPATAPPAAAAAAPPAPSLGDRVFAALGSLWLWVVVALILIAAAVLIFLRKHRETERSIEEDLAETGTWGTLEVGGRKPAVAVAAAGVRAREDQQAILVEESTPPLAPAREAAPAEEAPAESGSRGEEEYQYPFEDTIAGETGVNLDQSDPLAEADFHMAYGLYDQAAEIIQKAIDREPDRYDLRRKLLDICFVWGNSEEFLSQAQAIRDMAGGPDAGEWAKIAIMGRQICPGEAMFADESSTPVDVELGGAERAEGEAGDEPPEQWLDFDVGESDEPLEALGDTREQPGPSLEGRPKVEQTAELDLEELGIDLELGETGEYALKDLAERAPEFPDESGEYRDGTAQMPGAPEAAEEEREPDGGTMMLDPSTMRRASEEPTQRGEGWELADDEEPTMSEAGGFEEVGEQPTDQTQMQKRLSDDDEPTKAAFGGFDEEDEESDRTLIKKVVPSDEAPTTEVGGFEDELDADLDLDDLTQALQADVEQSADEGESTRERSGGPPPPAAAESEAFDARDMPTDEFSEVGTKLDLARAYVDMGDPDGARSILGEVLEEGDETQREEARELLDSLG
jgi:pilus assembly protein FimV